MTTKRDKKDEPKAAKRPKLKKETVKDLDLGKLGQEVKGGGATREAFCGGDQSI